MPRYDIMEAVGGAEGQAGPKTFIVFFLCAALSGLGVGASLLVFGSELTKINQWVVGVIITIGVLGVNYATKFADPDLRDSFSPLDIIQYLTQGFAWPSAWPSLAEKLGFDDGAITPPEEQAASAWNAGERLLSMIYSLPTDGATWWAM